MAQRHPGKVSVMIAPSSSLVLSEKLPWQAPVADEDIYHDSIVERLSGQAAVYDLRKTLRAHGDEYIFYSTDHHWTSAVSYTHLDVYKRQGQNSGAASPSYT